MDYFEAVNKRYSYRGKFQDKPVKDEDIRTMLDAAIKAPSGLNKQSTSFIVVNDRQLLDELNSIMPHDGIATAPVAIVALSEHIEAYKGVAFELQDYAAAMENLLLAVTALGYATVWTDGITAEGDIPRRVAELLNVPEGKTVQAIMPIGVPEKEGTQANKKPFEERVHYNSY